MDAGGCLDFREGLKGLENPYGNGGAATAILDVLRRQSFTGLLKKSFYDIGLSGADGAARAGER